MKALVLHGREDLRLEDRPLPRIATEDEILVRILNAGICGSDKHYYTTGANGSFVLREPFILGHEGCGILVEKGRNVTAFSEGDLLVFRPPQPCGSCFHCRRGNYRFCENVRHLGSAAKLPHTQGLFAEYAVVNQGQCLRLPRDISPVKAAVAEPLSVGYAAVNVLGNLIGRDVAVIGAGPIGILSAAAAKTVGARSVTLIGLSDDALRRARLMGVDRTINSRSDPAALEPLYEHAGVFDCGIEAAGSPDACGQLMRMIKPTGSLSQVGVFPHGKNAFDFSTFTSKNLRWLSVFRFHEEFDSAVAAIERGLIDPEPVVSAVYDCGDYRAAVENALSPLSVKVEIRFGKPE